MHRPHRTAVVLVALGVLVSGCYGPFNLTRRLYHWNGQVGDKWENEFVFLILAFLPVYGLVTFGDAVVFNSMEFWTGKNPVEPPTAKLPQTKRIARGGEEAVLTYVPGTDGAQLAIEQFRQGQPAGGFRLERRDGESVGLDQDGRVLFTATTQLDGGVLVQDAQGRQVASYSADQVEQLHTSARQ